MEFVTLEKAELGSWDVLLIDQAAMPRADDELLERLSILRQRANRLVWLDTTDSSGDTRFQVLDSVDLYTKRHLLKDTSIYSHPSITVNLFEAYYETLLKDLGVTYHTHIDRPSEIKHALAPHDIGRIRLSWTFAYIDVEARNRWIQMARNLKGGYPSADQATCHLPLDEVGAFFTSGASDIRGAVRKIALDQARIHGWKTFKGRVSTRTYLDSLSSVGGVVSPFGHGEMTYRDFEVAWFGALLFKPSVEHLNTFPNLLKPWETYIPLSWNPQLWGSEVQKGVTHENAKQIRDSLHEWSSSMGSDSSRDAFISHFHRCIVLSQKCGLCEIPK